ncbi:MAG: WD40 repeat domain-containing protein, partial [Bacteroidia bacterium]|nr:WD40 repeat domain-containing protein [Bacteroidia bacterium]
LLIPRALSIYLRRMLGEIEGEHHNAARLQGRRWAIAHQQPTLLTLALDGCRGLQGAARPGLAVFNLLEMIHEVRGEWTGVELNELDLYGITLNSRFIRSSTSSPQLTGSILNKLLLFLHREKENVNVVSYSPDGKRLILGFSNGSISEWDSETGACLKEIKGHSRPVQVLVYRPDGAGFLSAERASGTIKEWNAHTGTCIRTFEGHSGGVLCIAFHPSKNRFISGSSDRSIMEWDILTGICIRSYLGMDNKQSVRTVAYSPSGKQIISSVGGSINIWDTESGLCIESHFWELKVRDITSIDYNPNRNSLLAGLDCQGQFGGLAELLLESGRMGKTFIGHRYIRAVTFRADGEKFLSGSYAGTIKEWSYSSEFPIKHFGAVGDSVWSLAYHPDGKRFISGQKNGIAKEWDSTTGLSTKTFGGYFNTVHSIAFHPNGRHFVVASPDGSIKQWDCIAGVCVRIIEGHNTATLALAYRQDGKGFISGAEDGTISEWESETGICIRTFKAEPTWNLKLLSHPDGNGIITVYPRSIQEWDPSNGTCLSITEEYTNHQVATYSSDGERYCSATGSMIKEWDPATGACIRTFNGHTGRVRSIAYRPDRERIISGSSDGTIKEWDAETGECLRTFLNIPGLNVQGWDFRGAEHDFTEEDIELLRMYGAIFSEADEARWRGIMAEEEAYYAGRE